MNKREKEYDNIRKRMNKKEWEKKKKENVPQKRGNKNMTIVGI